MAGGEGERQRTIHRALELLIAHLAVQIANTGLLVQLHGDGLLVVAEEAGEDGWEGLVLLLSH